MPTIKKLLDANRAWSDRAREKDPTFFQRLSRQQSPQFLWVGCSDSRVPANQIIGMEPGMVFVHRNIANVVVHTDLNFLSVLQYAVEVLQIRHVIVCGHYGCGGVGAALQNAKHGLIDNWLRHIRDVRDRHADELEQLPELKRHDRLCELNVLAQVANVCQTTVMEDAWDRGQKVSVHGWIYGLTDGLLHDLGLTIDEHIRSKM